MSILAISISTGAPIKGKHTPPNIVLLLADDLGWIDLATSGTSLGNNSKYHQTPNLDKLAEKGVSFSSMYVCQNCAPSRAALLSGQYAPHTRIYNVESLDRGNKNSLIKPISQTVELNPDIITIAETLQKAGYLTAHFGKCGVGSTALLENSHGFDVSYTTKINKVEKKLQTGYYPRPDENGKLQFNMYGDMVGSRMSQFTEPYSALYINRFLKPYANSNDPSTLIGTPKHLTDAMADATSDFLGKEWTKRGKNKPFFMYVAFNQVHVPIEPRPDLLAKYEKLKSNDPRNKDVEYASFTEHLDQVCQRIIDQLKDPNGDGDTSDDISGNTVIMFTSDNGGPGKKINRNAPLRGSKGMQYDGGIRVPMIIQWPGKTIPGTTCSEALHAIDIYPTLAEIGGAKFPDPKLYPLDGESFAPILLGQKKHLNRDAIFGHFPGYMDSRSKPTTFIIRDFGDERYKMFYFYEPQIYELYKISTDIGESENLLAGKPSEKVLSVANNMRYGMLGWLKKMDPEQMTYRSSGQLVPLPIPISKN